MLLLRTFPVTDAMNKGDFLLLGFQMAVERFQAGIAHCQCLRLDFGKLLLRVFPPAEGIATCSTLYLCTVYKYGLVIHFSHLFQFGDELVEKVFQCILAPACAEAGNGCMIRGLLTVQKPQKVYPVAAGLLDFTGRVDAALVGVGNYLKQYRWIVFRFPSSGRIGFIQFAVTQFLKLEPCQSDRCVLR